MQPPPRLPKPGRPIPTRPEGVGHPGPFSVIIRFPILPGVRLPVEAGAELGRARSRDAVWASSLELWGRDQGRDQTVCVVVARIDDATIIKKGTYSYGAYVSAY